MPNQASCGLKKQFRSRYLDRQNVFYRLYDACKAYAIYGSESLGLTRKDQY
jgi:hypothetical protein